ncbi:MAG TPA: NAD-dependent epimerase/dehydratase family protein [Gemmatimonadaceae bacterium]|nr:NAD-dependent epimerase/dehydratase family protein [Gemmatimonadaceae bacterium]
MLITGGAGFIGCNLAHRLLQQGRRVVLFDNLSRAGVTRNVAWLRETHGDHVRVEIGDVRDFAAVQRAVAGVGQVFHFAAQVAVTTSLDDPVDDFTVNARGTLNVLEAIRRSDERPPLVLTSTNKVYGGLDDLALELRDARYTPRDEAIAARGVSEARPLDFHSPYGCSKGTADQYVRDYARSFGLKTVVFRMSCIYGPHQFGTEDQGWVAHFLIRALAGEPIVLYGDGKQVRDILFVDDLVNAFLLAQQHMPALSGQAFNIGGGAGNTISLLELLDVIAALNGSRPAVTFEDWRVGDQRYYVSDTTKFARATGWRQTVSAVEGVTRLRDWLGTEAARAKRPAARAKRPIVIDPVGAADAGMVDRGAA